MTRDPMAGGFVPKLVLSDMDGTLLDPDKRLTDRARAAVAALHARGVGFALTSSRPPRAMRPFAEALEVRLPLSAFNGGLIEARDGATLRSRPMDDRVAVRVIEFLRARGVDVWLYRGDDWIVDDTEGEYVAREAETLGYKPVAAKDLAAEANGAVKLVASSSDLDLMARCQGEVREAFPEVAAALSQPKYLDVTASGVDKGGSVRVIAAGAGVEPGEVMVVGDGHNDLPMFEAAGLAVAMGQADDAVRRRAHAVTASNADEGFAEAVERHVLSRPPAAEGAA